MSSGERAGIVVVTGAGFTRALVPSAPLLVGDFENDKLERKVSGMPAAARMLRRERNREGGHNINLERLMTRLESLMPYDKTHRAGNAANEYEYLLSELKRALERGIRGAREGEVRCDDLDRFARYCGGVGCDCITFNYDDFLDEALLRTQKHRGTWTPFAGYGFFCKSASGMSGVEEGWPHGSKIQLLKLHGSINWRRKLGYGKEGVVDAIVHQHGWSGMSGRLPGVEDHLDPEPVIVPPVLSKSVLEEPVMRIVWSKAFDVLDQAGEVTFVGYSFPETDIGARTLFQEGLEGLPGVGSGWSTEQARPTSLRRRRGGIGACLARSRRATSCSRMHLTGFVGSRYRRLIGRDGELWEANS